MLHRRDLQLGEIPQRVRDIPALEQDRKIDEKSPTVVADTGGEHVDELQDARSETEETPRYQPEGDDRRSRQVRLLLDYEAYLDRRKQSRPRQSHPDGEHVTIVREHVECLYRSAGRKTAGDHTADQPVGNWKSDGGVRSSQIRKAVFLLLPPQREPPRVQLAPRLSVPVGFHANLRFEYWNCSSCVATFSVRDYDGVVDQRERGQVTYIDSFLLNAVESFCHRFQRLTGRTNVWLAVQLTNISVIMYFVWAGLFFWSTDLVLRIFVGLFCGGVLYALTQTVFKVPIEESENNAYRRVAKGLRNPRRLRDALLRISFLNLSILLSYPAYLAYAVLRVHIVLMGYFLIVMTTVLLYLLACDPLPPCAGKVRAWLRGAVRLRPAAVRTR
jgi:hypothetical protein